MSTTVTAKGQVTIPKPVRDLLGITPGSNVTFEVDEDGRVVLRTEAAVTASRFARLRGAASVDMTTEQIMALTRGED